MKLPLAIALCLLASSPALGQVSAPFAPARGRSDAPAAAAQIHPAVARIVAPGNGSISYGSGTLVFADDRSALVVTNWHVVNEATGQISVHFPDGFYSLGTVQNVDRDWDLAAIAIRKPPGVQPVSLANHAPRPGEMLTIAGYGSGTYRAVSGPCTQYVAPGTTFPFEMVELAASARQGDSGGPIFNSQGELAGVLFGEGHGRTSGSYCGRVKWFLSSVVPATPPTITSPDVSVVATAPLQPVPMRPGALEVAAPQVAVAPPHQQSEPVERLVNSSTAFSAPQVGPQALPSARPAALEAQRITWQDLAGSTAGEQIKTVMAAIGGLLMILHLLRWVSREPAAA